MVSEFDLLVIGAGSGGVRCARIAAQYGAKVAIVEARHWGGTCVNIGCVPKKLMVYAADYAEMAQEARSFGWEGTTWQHDWGRLISAKNDEISRLNNIYSSMLEKAGVTLIIGSASFVSRNEVAVTPSALDPLAKPRRIRARKIVIAVGGAPSRPDIEGAELGIVSDDAFYLTERPEKILIIGGGYIGVEFAGIFSRLGSDVTMVLRGQMPLRGFDEDLRIHLTEAMKRHGIHQHAGVSPHRIRRLPDGSFETTLENGGVILSHCVFFATGRHSMIDGLNLDAIGVACSEGRIVTDTSFATSIPHIYAIGDVTDQNNLTPVAIAQGHILADRIFGGRDRYWSFETTPKAVFYSQPLASVGLTEEEASREAAVDVFLTSFRSMRQSLKKGDDKVFIKLVVDTRDDRVVGAHMMGDAAPEIIQAVAIAVTAGLRKADFDQTIGLHPTTAEEIVTLRTVTRRTLRRCA